MTMKVLFDHPSPFLLAHGGFQIQIEQTKGALEAAGIEVEWLRWWDSFQKGDVVHYFGRPPIWYIEFAQAKKMKVVLEQLLSGTGSRSRQLLWLQRLAIRTGGIFFPRMRSTPFAWKAFEIADGCIANTSWEAHLMTYLFRAPPAKTHVLPNGVEDVFLNSAASIRGPWLICTATITQRKRTLEVAEAAVQAKIPLWIIGKAYAENDDYYQKFLSLSQKSRDLIRYEGAIEDRSQLAKIYREARGFVLLSTQESRSLSAEEAAACQCPLLLSELPWAKSVFRNQVRYCPIASPAKTARYLRQFYDDAPNLKPPATPISWNEVGRQLKGIYERL